MEKKVSDQFRACKIEDTTGCIEALKKAFGCHIIKSIIGTEKKSTTVFELVDNEHCDIHVAHIGDYVVCDPDGKIRVMKPDKFHDEFSIHSMDQSVNEPLEKRCSMLQQRCVELQNMVNNLSEIVENQDNEIMDQTELEFENGQLEKKVSHLLDEAKKWKSVSVKLQNQLDELTVIPRGVSPTAYILLGLIDKIYSINEANGWHEDDRDFAEYIANFHGELSEAWEEYRAHGDQFNFMIYQKNGKPEGIAVELWDCIIRIFDYFGKFSQQQKKEIVGALQTKLQYNQTRGYRHGGKKA